MWAMLKNHKSDLLSISIILIFFFIMLAISWGKLGSIVVDCFRNAYVPSELLKGNLLYRDIFHYYCPLVPYLHMGLFKIAGVHLNVLYTIGATLSFLMLGGFYYLARQLLPVWMAFALLVFFLARLIFFSGIFQFIFPYSYEALYGSFFILLTMISIVLYLKPFATKHHDQPYSEQSSSRSTYWLILAALFTTTTAFIKQDSAMIAYLTLFLSFAYLIIVEKTSLKKLGAILLLPLLLPIIIYGIIGVFFIPFPYLLEGLFPFDKIDPGAYKDTAGSAISLPLFGYALKSMTWFLWRSIPIIGIFYLLYILVELYLPRLKMIAPFVLLMASLSLLFMGESSFLYNWITNSFESQSFAGISLILLGQLFWYGRKYVKNPEKIVDKDKWLILFSLWGLAALIRTPLNLHLTSQLSYYVFLPLLCGTYFLFHDLAQMMKTPWRWPYQQSLWTYILLLAAVITITNINYLILIKQYPLSNERGTFYTKHCYYALWEKALTITDKMTDKNDRIAVFPEEISINYFANRRSGTRFIQTLPGALKSAKEERLFIAELARKKPTLIFVTNRLSPAYSKKLWGFDYHALVYKWIQENYTRLSTINTDCTGKSNAYPNKIEIYALSKR